MWVEAIRTSGGSGGIEGVNDHTTDREPGSFDVGRLGADERRHSLDGALVGLRLLEHRQDARLDKLGNLHRVACCGARACSALVINALIVSVFSTNDAWALGLNIVSVRMKRL
jgi:hypothetical protein